MSDIITQIKNAEAAKQQALGQLHVELGYASAQALADAILQAATSSEVSARVTNAKASAAKSDAGAPKATASRKGRRIPDSVRSQIAAALKAGETASQLPERFGVSYNIIHEVKKKIGLVTARG